MSPLYCAAPRTTMASTVTSLIALAGPPHLRKASRGSRRRARSRTTASTPSTVRRSQRAPGRIRHGEPSPALPDAARRRGRAAPSRRPSSSSDSNSGGPTVRPVTATRTGACALDSFIPCASPTARSASFRSSARQAGNASYAAMIPSSTGAAAACDRLVHAASSRRFVEEQEVDVLGYLVPRRCIRVCTSGAMAANTSASNCSPDHGACGATSHGCAHAR